MSHEDYFLEYAAPFSSAPIVQQTSSGHSCSLNIDDKCIPNMPPIAMAAASCSSFGANGGGACPQRTALFCSSNQPYSADNGWMCDIQREDLARRGIA